MYIRNVAGFVEDPLLAVNTNKRVRFLFLGDDLVPLNSTARSITVELYANYDAYINNYQPVVKGTATQINNCYDADSSSTCYISHTGSSTVGQFQLQELSDTSMQVSYKPNGTYNFGALYVNHFFDISFHGFSFDSSCSISDVKAQISTSDQPGNGANNTIAFHTSFCSANRIYFRWNGDRPFSDYFGDQTDDSWASN